MEWSNNLKVVRGHSRKEGKPIHATHEIITGSEVFGRWIETMRRSLRRRCTVPVIAFDFFDGVLERG